LLAHPGFFVGWLYRPHPQDPPALAPHEGFGQDEPQTLLHEAGGGAPHEPPCTTGGSTAGSGETFPPSASSSTTARTLKASKTSKASPPAQSIFLGVFLFFMLHPGFM